MSLHVPSLPSAPAWLLRRAPRRTVRLRLTLLYGAVFLLAGAVLLTITYALVASNQGPATASVKTRNGQLFIVAGPADLSVPSPFSRSSGAHAPKPKAVYTQTPNGDALVRQVSAAGSAVPQGERVLSHSPLPPNLNPPPRAIRQLAGSLQNAVVTEHANELHQLLLWSAIALAIMALVSAALGWLMAGRVLEPLRTMTARARRISDHNLHERLAVAGPEDELKELGDAFDALLGRLEGAFAAQRRFVANASHELRTPLTLERAMVEVALADPDADADSLRQTCRRVLDAGEQQERLIEGLLTLARGQQGIEESEHVDLGDVSRHVLDALDASPSRDGLRVESELGHAATSGDERLLERLVANLVDNAVRHNVADGWVRIWTGVRSGRPTLSVSNTGPMIEPAELEGLLEPFRRAGADRTRHRNGHGLGLSIVAAIAAAHHASLRTTARAEGGLDVEVSFSP
jgi:signal transduction histidine kinase